MITQFIAFIQFVFENLLYLFYFMNITFHTIDSLRVMNFVRLIKNLDFLFFSLKFVDLPKLNAMKVVSFKYLILKLILIFWYC